MKKPQMMKGEHIPRKHSSQMRSNKSSKIEVNELLYKLDGNQLQQIATDLFNGVTDVANNALAYGQECERTQQVYAQSNAEIKKYEMKLERTKEKEKTKLEEIKAESIRNHENYLFDMEKEQNSHEIIMQILKRVEDASISSEQLIDLIHAAKK